MDLENKVVVIAGGSEGFGKSLARAFSVEESRVVITSHEKDKLEKTAKELSVDFMVADATNPKDVSKLAQYVFEKYQTIDIWINNAGIQIAPSVVEEVDVEKLHYLFEVNFFGYFYGCQNALRYMRQQGSGLIINVNSTAGLEGKPQLSAYSSSKFAIKGLTESLRKELVDTKIQVFSIYPGGMQTDIYKEKYPSDINEYMQVSEVAQKIIENLKLEHPEQDLVIRRQKA